MPDPIIDDPNTVLDGEWYDAVAPETEENAAAREMYAKFETHDAFLTAHNEAVNRNWRAEIAGEDDKFATTLERFENPGAFGNAFREAQQTISAGKYKETLPASDASEDDVKAYREANGIPFEAKGYLENLPDGLVLGDDDAPIAEVFMDALHSVHAPPGVAHALIAKYSEFAEEAQASREELDIEQSKEATDSLRAQWKGDYRANFNMVGAFLENTFGKEVKDQLLNGRFQDGRAFMNDPKVMMGLAAAQRKLDPVTQIVPSGEDPEATLNEEIAEIELYMKEHRTAYNKDETKQARLRQLYDIRTKHKEAQKNAA